MEIHYRALEALLNDKCLKYDFNFAVKDTERRKRQHNKSGSDYDSGESTPFMCLQPTKPSAVANVR